MFKTDFSQVLRTRDALRAEIQRRLDAIDGPQLRLLGVMAVEAMVERARRLTNINPHTGLPNQGKRQPAGRKLSRAASAHRIGAR